KDKSSPQIFTDSHRSGGQLCRNEQMSCRKLARAFNGGVAVLLLEFDSHKRCRLFADVGKRVDEAAGNPGDVAGVLMDFFALAVSIHATQIEIRERHS